MCVTGVGDLEKVRCLKQWGRKRERKKERKMRSVTKTEGLNTIRKREGNQFHSVQVMRGFLRRPSHPVVREKSPGSHTRVG